MTSPPWQAFSAIVVPGHRVASGQSGDPRFPGGTIRMQMPMFQRQGLDLSGFFPGTLNVSIAPARFTVGRPRCTFNRVKWHPTQPPEDFSFFDVSLTKDDGSIIAGLIYYPHPQTKPEHFQPDGVLELLFPPLDQVHYNDTVQLAVPVDQMTIALG